MSFLQSDGGLPDFNKAVISLWFRVPKVSVTAAKASQGYDPATMISGAVIPLLTFGGLTEGFNSGNVENVYSGIVTYHTGHLNSSTDFIEDFPTSIITGIDYTMVAAKFSEPILLPPSMIAIDCSGDAPCIYVNLQTPNRAHRTGDFAYLSDGTYGSDVYTITSSIGTDASGTLPPPDFMRQKNWIHIGDDITDFMLSGRPEVFYGRSNVPITADVWHHLLISFDISRSIGNGVSGCKMWLALDDVNCGRESLPALTDSAHEANTIFAQGGVYPDGPPRLPQPHPSGWYIAGQTESGAPTYVWIDTTITGAFEPRTYRFSPAPLKGSPLHVPAPGSAVYEVQMAELQIFTGVTLDTGVEANRRAFINSRGEPVDPLYGLEKARGIFGPETPNVTPSPPVQLLGKMPDISLTRMASNWGAGVNLGTAKVSLKPTGAIKPVRPDPVVGK